MFNFISFLLIFLSMQQNANAAAKSTSFEFKPMGIGVLGMEYNQAQHSDIVSDRINSDTLKSSKGFMFTRELGWPFGIETGLTYLYNKDVKVTWNNTADTPVEFYAYFLLIGIKITLPLPIIQPWVSAGYGFGKMIMSNTHDREYDNYLIGINTKGTEHAGTQYYRAGLDLPIGSASGLRFSATQLTPDTGKSTQVGSDTYNMKIINYGLGLFAYY